MTKLGHSGIQNLKTYFKTCCIVRGTIAFFSVPNCSKKLGEGKGTSSGSFVPGRFSVPSARAVVGGGELMGRNWTASKGCR